MSASVVPTFSFDTGTLPASQRFAMWRDVMAATHEVRTEQDTADDFTGQVSLWQLDQLLLSHGRFAGQTFDRSNASIRRDHLDHIGLFVQMEGERRSRTRTSDVLLLPGDVLVADFAQEMVSDTTDGRSGTLYLPRGMVEDILPDISRLHGVVLRSPTARLLGQHIFTLGRDMHELAPQVVSHLAVASRELALASLLEHQSVEEPNLSSETARRRLLVRYIDDHLDQPELGAGQICAEFGLSRATVYRLFQSSGGLAAYIKRRRLQRIRSVLLHGNDPRPIGQIALHHGFASEAHFNREFRALFGHTPGSLRAASRPGNEGTLPGPPEISRMFQTICT